MPIDLNAPLTQTDPEVAQQIHNEILRQHEGLEMIASENFVSRAVLEAVGTVFTNKYAEGYPGKRYYGGCEYADVVENLARDRAKLLFGAEHANVQPHSGSQANAAAFMTSSSSPAKPSSASTSPTAATSPTATSSTSPASSTTSPATRSARTPRSLTTTQLEQQAIEVQPKVLIGGGSAYPASSTSPA